MRFFILALFAIALLLMVIARCFDGRPFSPAEGLAFICIIVGLFVMLLWGLVGGVFA